MGHMGPTGTDDGQQLKGIWGKDVIWTHLARDRNQWRALLKMLTSGYLEMLEIS
jgi:hypothetical protein